MSPCYDYSIYQRRTNVRCEFTQNTRESSSKEFHTNPQMHLPGRSIKTHYGILLRIAVACGPGVFLPRRRTAPHVHI